MADVPDGEVVVLSDAAAACGPSPLEEALDESSEVQYESTSTRVMKVEHLIAICLQTGRVKDRDRVRLLLEEAVVDRNLLGQILNRHDLEERWKQWTQ